MCIIQKMTRFRGNQSGGGKSGTLWAEGMGCWPCATKSKALITKYWHVLQIRDTDRNEKQISAARRAHKSRLIGSWLDHLIASLLSVKTSWAINDIKIFFRPVVGCGNGRCLSRKNSWNILKSCIRKVNFILNPYGLFTSTKLLKVIFRLNSFTL